MSSAENTPRPPIERSDPSRFLASERFHQLTAHYAAILQMAQPALQSGGIPDAFLAHPETDTRMAVALVLRPPETVRQAIRQTLDALAAEFLELYDYPVDDLHLTVLDVQRGRPGLEKPSPEQIHKYVNCIEFLNHFTRLSPFQIQCKGLTLSDSALLVNGYDDGGLERLRMFLRQALQLAGLPLEERYKTASCHITAARFREKLHAPAALLARVQQLADTDFGAFEVTGMELTYHNWYDSKKECLAVFSFPLKEM